MGHLRLASAQEFFERVTVEQLDTWIKALRNWKIPHRYRDFARFKELFKSKDLQPKPKKTVKLVAYHFSRAEDDQENVGFYNHYIRGLLRWHRGSAVWIKGGVAKGEAYLVVKGYLKQRVAGILSDELSQRGFLAFKVVNPFFAIHQAKELNRQTRGYLRHGDIELGDYDGTFCPLEGYKQVSVRQCCIGTEEGQDTCSHWDRYRCIYPKKTGVPKVETTWCPEKQTEVASLQCEDCKKSDFARWRACREFKKEEGINVGL